MNPAVFGGLDVVLHVADEERLIRFEAVFFENLVNLFPLIPNIEVRFIEEFVETGHAALNGEVISMDRAEEKCAKSFRPAELEELARMRQLADGILHLPEPAVKPGFQLRKRHVWDEALVKAGERQAKLSAECLERDLLFLRLGQ